jgi:hypothetical protein
MMLCMATDPNHSEHAPDQPSSSSDLEGSMSEEILRRLSEDLEQDKLEQPVRRWKLLVGSIALVIVLVVAGIVYYLLR